MQVIYTKHMMSLIILTISLASLIYFVARFFYPRSQRPFLAIGALLAIIIVAATVLGVRIWNERAFIPYPKAYLTRLAWLEGAPSSEDGMDCAKFIANAHGQELGFTFWKDRTIIVNTIQNRTGLTETGLLPGDVANFNGQHVAVFLGRGEWIDADYRRGTVAKFHLCDKPESDPWFQGPITIRRFKEGVK